MTFWGISIGDYRQDGIEEIPVILPAGDTGFCLHFADADNVSAETFIENVALNLVAQLPLGSLHIHLWDYAVRNRFPYLSELKNYGVYHLAADSRAAESAFDELEAMIRQRHHELLSVQNPDLNTYNENSTYPEAYHLILINADEYPDERSSLKRWQSLYAAAAAAGVYFLAYTTDTREERQPARDWLRETLPALNLHRGTLMIPEKTFAYNQLKYWYSFEMLSINKQQVMAQIAQQFAAQKQDDQQQDYLDIRIGSSLDGRQPVYFTLGYRKGNHHALLNGRTGSGKSALLNNLILRIGEQFNADEFRIYLMDYKEGVEFQAFKNHPNVEKIYLDNTDIQAAENLLQEFAGICQQRGQLFLQSRVNNINTYNRQYPQTPLPRYLLIIDEFQVMFGKNDYRRAARINALLATISKQGLSFGIHLLLASQSLLNVDIESDVLAQIGLRLTFKLNDEKSALKILDFNNTTVALNLGQYQLLYNDNAGQKSGNHILRTDPPQDIDATIARIRASRPKRQCLQAEIATTARDPFAAKKPESRQESGRTLPEQNSSFTDNQEAEALLAKLQRKLSGEE